MAAALDSGTPFHLCPGDLRSAQVLRALAHDAPVRAGHDAHAHHGHAVAPGVAAMHAMDAGADPSTGAPADGAAGHGHHGALADVLDNDAADTGCIVAGGPGMAVASVPSEPDPVARASVPFPIPRSAAPRDARWLRPPVRSPPV
jgi:hypothetical protein